MSKKPAILIIGGGLLQVVAVEKAKSLGYATYVTDKNKDAPALKAADYPIVLSSKDIKGHKELARELRASNGLKGVYTQGTDVELTVAEAAHYAGLPGISPQAARNCNNKYLMRQRLKEAGMGRPRFECVEDKSQVKRAVKNIGLPAVIKPLDNSASRGLKIIYDINEAESAFEEALHYCFYDKMALVEEFLCGEEYSVDTVIWKNKLYPAGISDREFDRSSGHAIQTGSRTPSVLPARLQQQMYELMQKAADILGVDKGAFKGDLIVVEGRPLIIEVTARTSGGFDSQYRKPYSFGIDIIKATIDIACGLELDFSDLVPKWIKWSKTFTKFHPPGKIKRISGIEKALASPAIKNIFITAKEGDIVEGFKHCANRTNHIIAVEDTLEQLNMAVAQCLDTLNIEVESV